MQIIIVSHKGVPNTPRVFDREGTAEAHYETLCMTYLGEDYDDIVGDFYDDMVYDRVNEYLSSQKIRIDYFTI